MIKKTKYAIVLLSAGTSSRLKQPKQLLPFQHTTLLQHIINNLSDIPNTDLYVVLGAEYDIIKSSLTSGNYALINNTAYLKGMGASIARGIKGLESETYAGAIIALGDQVYLNEKVILQLIAQHKGNSSIVNCSYENKIQGPPTLFGKDYFVALSKLEDDHGAKPIINTFKDHVETISWRDGIFDVDTIDDYKNLLKRNEEV